MSSYNLTQITYPSSDGKHTVYAEIYTPKVATARAVVQLAHGMIDYTGRYAGFAEYLCSKGYILAGNHHLGHGKSVMSEEDYGFFAEKGGLDFVIEDMHTLNRRIRSDFPVLPVILLGHSMGSFLSRLYAVKHPHTVKGLIIHGTGGKNPLVGMGLAVAKLIRMFKGERHRSGLIKALAFGSYNKRFPKEEGADAWLTRDIAAVAGRSTDPYTSFDFTVSGYIDLFTALKTCNSKSWYKSFPKELPTLVISGEMDPVGDYGKGPREVYKGLLMSGVTSAELKLYPDCRHELFNEYNRDEVFADIVKWLGGVI